MLPFRVIKKAARDAIRAALPFSVLTSLIYAAISVAASEVQLRVSGVYAISREIADRFLELAKSGALSDFPLLTDFYRSRLSLSGSLLAFAVGLLITVLGTGFAWYCLRVARGEQPRWTALFDGFERVSRVLWLRILRAVLVSLWSLLFIFPGIIAAYRYSQAELLLYDHPDYSARRCLKESSRLMRGSKVSLFMLLLSFIGWVFLGVLLSLLIGFALLDIWINLYIGVAMAVFYLRLTNEGLS